MSWIKITEDTLPDLGKPVIAGWSKSPFHKDGRPYAWPNALERFFDDFDGWLWAEPRSGDIMEWSEDEQPTHYQPWPEPPEAL